MARRSIEPWDWAEPDIAPAPPICVPTAADPPPATAAAEPTAWDDPGSLHGYREDGSNVRPRGPARRRRPAAPSKFSPEQRAEIRRLARQGWPSGALARRFHCSPGTIRNLLRGRSHAADRADPVPPPPPSTPIGKQAPDPPIMPAGQERRKRKSPPSQYAKLDAEARAEIRRLAREEGWGSKRLAKRFGVDRKTIRDLLHGRSYFDDPDAPIAPPPKARPKRWDVDADDPLGRDPEPAAGDVAELVRAEVPIDLVELDPPEPPATIAEAPGSADPEWDDEPDRTQRPGLRGLTETDDERAWRWYQEGVSWRKIAMRLDVHPATAKAAGMRAASRESRMHSD